MAGAVQLVCSWAIRFELGVTPVADENAGTSRDLGVCMHTDALVGRSRALAGLTPGLTPANGGVFQCIPGSRQCAFTPRKSPSELGLPAGAGLLAQVSAAGSRQPENAKTAAPNGSHHPTSMAANPGSTTTTTRRTTSSTTTRRTTIPSYRDGVNRRCRRLLVTNLASGVTAPILVVSRRGEPDRHPERDAGVPGDYLILGWTTCCARRRSASQVWRSNVGVLSADAALRRGRSTHPLRGRRRG